MYNNVKYSRLSKAEDENFKLDNTTDTFNYNSAFSYDAGRNKYAKNDYNSVYKYTSNIGGREAHVALNMTGGRRVENEVFEDVRTPSFWLLVTSWILTVLSYTLFAVTAPISYWILVKKLGEFDRLVVFRLGKMIGVKGPGRVLIFPWMDRTKCIDVRAAAFAVPPQQFITCDGGIVEMGAEIQYGIVDVVTMVSEVADHQDILRSLGKTVLVKILVKKTVQQLDRDKRRPAGEIQDELNDQVRKWGIDVHKVELSEPKILKQPDNGGTSAMGSILKGLGVKGDPKYPTPEEFVRASHGFDESSRGGGTNFVSAATLGLGGNSAPLGMPATGMEGLLQMMGGGGGGGGGGNNHFSGHVHFGSSIAGKGLDEDGLSVSNWGRCLDMILQAEMGPSVPIEDDSIGVYKIEITDTPTGTEKYYIELTQESRRVRSDSDPPARKPDVWVTVSSSDLAAVLEGSLSPLQAYLTGRICANGDVKKLMFFDKLSKRGHKPGTMFNV